MTRKIGMFSNNRRKNSGDAEIANKFFSSFYSFLFYKKTLTLGETFLRLKLFKR